MKIALEDPAWERLYGPYGVEPVPQILAQLLARWDDELANDLFWEKLYHQQSLYPVTYAALPWLRQIAEEQQTARVEAMVFLSAVIKAVGLEDEAGEFAGLPLDRLAALPPLQQLADWFTVHQDRMVQACFDTATGIAPTDGAASHRLNGPLVYRGTRMLGYSIEAAESDFVAICPACGLVHDVVHTPAGPTFVARRDNDCDCEPRFAFSPTPEDTARERQTARALAARFPADHRVARSLTAWADWSCCD